MSNHFSDNDLSLINSLNEAYNNNLRSIQNFTNSINDLTDMNVEIHNFIVDILHNRNVVLNNRENIRGTRNTIRRPTISTTTERNTTERNTTERNTAERNTAERNTTERNNLGRLIVNNIPYIIDSIQQYRIPFRNQRERSRNSNIVNLFLERFFEPVEIFPTQTQIEIATRNVRYCDILNPINISCPISLENFSDFDNVTVIRHCGHIFKRQELITWFRSNCICPVCRYDIRNYNTNFFDLSGNQTTNISIDTSNNSFMQTDNNYQEDIDEENIGEENIDNEVERIIEETNSNNNSNNTTRSNTDRSINLDLFFSDNSLLNNFSTFSDTTDTNALINLLRALQPRNNR
jgi:hypothetical protein